MQYKLLVSTALAATALAQTDAEQSSQDAEL